MAETAIEKTSSDISYSLEKLKIECEELREEIRELLELKEEEYVDLDIDMRKHLYIQLQIPENKIIIEENRQDRFCGFPFFLRKENKLENTVQVLTLHDYPKGVFLRVKLPAKSVAADESEEVIITDELINDFIQNKGLSGIMSQNWINCGSYNTKTYHELMAATLNLCIVGKEIIHEF